MLEPRGHEAERGPPSPRPMLILCYEKAAISCKVSGGKELKDGELRAKANGVSVLSPCPHRLFRCGLTFLKERCGRKDMLETHVRNLMESRLD